MYYKEFFLLFLKLSQFDADAFVILTGGDASVRLCLFLNSYHSYL